jgi:DNA primase
VATRRAFSNDHQTGGGHQGPDWGALSKTERSRFAEDVMATVGVSSWKEVGGDEWVHSCPDPFRLHAHGDRHPSASLSISKGLWHCHGCGNGGTVAWLIAVCTQVDLASAERKVAALGPDGTDLAEMLAYLDRLWDRQPETYTMPTYSLRVLEPWVSVVHPYLTEIRHVSVEAVVKFLVGFDDRTNRIVIPHFWEDRLVGWQSRRLSNDGSPKYLSTPGMPKDRTVFNYQRRAPEALVVESPMSVLVRDDHPCVEATFGASVTDRQVRLLARHDRVVLAMDNDPAGWEATKVVGEALSAYTSVWVVSNPWDADMADLSSEQFARVYDARVPYSIWTPPSVLEVLP